MASSMTGALPVPRHVDSDDVYGGGRAGGGRVGGGAAAPSSAASRSVPQYPYRTRGRPRFIPRTLEDFGEGGAYPEIDMLQFPLDMGRRGRGQAVSKTVTMRMDENGQADYAAVVKQGENASRVVHAQYTDMVEKPRDEKLLQRPGEEEERDTAERTKQALARIVDGKISAAQPNNFRGHDSDAKPTYIKYTPANSNPKHNSGSEQRLIRMMEAPVDPLEPPKFSQKKVPPAPPSPPAPVMHSPPRKLTAEDAKNWKIPPCISNWKNNKGYTIPLDKRLAADGRGLQDLRINDNFAQLAESMYMAERTAREMVEEHAKMQRHIALKEKDQKEQELRELAARARAERVGIVRPGAPAVDVASEVGRAARNLSPPASPPSSVPPPPPPPPDDDDDDNDRDEAKHAHGDRSRSRPTPPPPPRPPPPPLTGAARHRQSSSPERLRNRSPPSSPRRRREPDRERDGRYDRAEARSRDDGRRPLDRSRHDEDDKDAERERRKRDQMREDVHRELKRDMRMSARGDDGPAYKKSKFARDRDRDVSERIALGQKVGASTGKDEVVYDQRLYNQAKSGMDSGFAADDSYNLYDKPLFSGQGDGFLYRPTQGVEDAVNSSRFHADRGFSGGSGSTGAGGGAVAARGADTHASRGGAASARSKPVEFEKDAATSIKVQDGSGRAPAEDDPFGVGKFLTDAKNVRSERLDSALDSRRRSSMSLGGGGGGAAAAALREEERGRSGRRRSRDD